MASTDFTRGIRVYLETSDYTKGINELVQQNKKLNKEYDELKSKAGQLSSAEQKRLRQLEKQLKNNAETEIRYKKTLKETEETLKNLSGKTYNELVAARNQVRSELRNAVRGTAEYDARLKMHKELTRRVTLAEKEMSVAVGCQANVFGRVTGFVNRYWAVLGGGIAAITGISMRFRGMSEEVAKMDDVYSDVMKTTNLTHEQVGELNEQFKKMDTRTSRESLNNLARDAGKLGIEGSKNILDFVDAGNQINVALGEDLGEDAIKNIGKMVGVFDKSTKHLQQLDLKGQMLAVGSAINELGASSSANEQYLVDFAGRLGGVASQAGISIDAILGFGSALDQDMQKVEMAATAFQNFIMKLMGEPAKFAKIAGMDVKKFSDLLRTDANAAIKTVLRSLSEKGGFQQLIPIFNEMGLDGARAVGVLSSMASGIDKIDEAQRVANQALTEGTSITKEYGIKNENLQAKLEKARKEMKERTIELGQRLNPVLLKSTNILTYILKILPGLFSFFDKYGQTLLKVTALIIAYNLAIKAQTVWTKMALIEKGKMFIAVNREAAQMTFLAIRYVFTAKSGKELVAALKQLRVQLMLNPWGVALAGIVAFGYGLYKLSQNNAKLLTQSTAMVEINKQVANSVGRERAELDMLLSVARNEKISKDERLKAIHKLNEISPEYLGNLNLENINTDAARVSVEKYTKAIMENAKQKALADKMSELYGKKMEFETKIAEENRKIEEDKAKGILASNWVLQDAYKTRKGYFMKELDDVNKQIDVYAKLGETMMQNKTTSDNSYASKWQQLEHEKKLLSDLEKQHADLYNAQTPSGVLRDDPSKPKWGENSALTDKASLAITGQRLERQRAIVAEKQKELDASLKVAAVENNNNNSTPPGSSSKTDPATDAIKKEEEKYKQSLLNLRYLLQEKKKTEQQFADEGYQLQLDYLNKKMEVEKKYGKSTIDTENAILDLKDKNQKTADELMLKNMRNTYESAEKLINEGEQLSSNILADRRAKKLDDEKEHNRKKILLDVETAKARLSLLEATLEMTRKAELKDTELKQKTIDDLLEKIKKAKQVLFEAKTKQTADKYDNSEETKKEKSKKNLKKRSEEMREIFGEQFNELEVLFSNFYAFLDDLKDRNIEDWKDWAYAIGGIVQSALATTQKVSDQYYEYKRNELEADKERELTVAGDTAEKRKEIEQKYAQKELDLKKKQANADAGIKIAQTIAAGALAAVQAFAQLGPIGGAIAAALIATTTAFQIASIIKQRNAIMATTLDGSSGESSSTGKRVANSELPATPQAASGRWDVVGEDDGITYRNVPYRGVARTGIVTAPTLMGERGDELIIDNPTLRNIRMNAPYVLDAVRRYRVRQRAEGKWDEPTTESSGNEASFSFVVQENTSVMKAVLLVLQWLRENRIEAYTVLSEFEKKRDLRDKSVKKGSL